VKWANQVYVQGCLRIVIGANKLEDIHVAPDITPESMAALEERILFVQCDEKARVYLEHVKGLDPGWTQRPDGSAGALFRHALWLAANRKLSRPPKRLVVYGEPNGQWRHRRLANASGLDGSILVALAKWASDNRAATGIGVHPDYPGVVLVNPSHLMTLWVELTGDRNAPRLRSLASALALLNAWPAPKQITLRSYRSQYYAVRADLVLEAAETCGVGDLDSMRARLNGQAAPAATNRDPA